MPFETRRTMRFDFVDPDDETQTAYLRASSITFAEWRSILDSDQQLTRAVEVLTEHLIEWDFVQDGQPLPATAEGLDALEPSLRWFVVNQWIVGVRQAPAPLALKSVPPPPDGEQSEVPPMSMDDL